MLPHSWQAHRPIKRGPRGSSHHNGTEQAVHRRVRISQIPGASYF
jgi:hypothetical protein